MKKYLIAFLSISLIAVASYEPWRKASIGSGSTILITGETGKKALLQQMFFSFQNATNIYFFSGTSTQVSSAQATYKLTETLYFGANSGWDRVEGSIKIVGVKNENLSVWSSAATGSGITYKGDVVR
jgi:hypothetical protein